MTGRPPVWLGDALRAADALRADAATARTVAVLLGITHSSAPVLAPAPVLRPSPPPVVRPRPAVTERPAPPRARDVAPGPTDVPADPERPIVEPRRARPAEPPRSLPALTDVLDPPPEPAGRPPGLLDDRHRRALLTAVVSALAGTGELDVDAAVERVAQGRPLGRPPTVVRATTRRGVQVVVDGSPAMLPFARDQADVLTAVAHLLDGAALEVVHCAGSPLAGAGRGPIWTWRRYRPPVDARPVLALTDLGVLASPVDAAKVQAAWMRVAREVHAAGCPLVALLPVPLRRIPRPLRREVATVVWDRSTTVRDAVAAVRRAGGRSSGRPA